MLYYLRYILVFLSVSIFADTNFENPTTTAGGTPNLSLNDNKAIDSQITTDATGKYVYAIWQKYSDILNNVIQVSSSSDYGVTWSVPKNLSIVSAAPVKTPKITTDSTGKYVYAVWKDGAIIKASVSSNNGADWSLTPFDLTLGTDTCQFPEIVTDSTGKYVYVLCDLKAPNFGTIFIRSTNSGASWLPPAQIFFSFSSANAPVDIATDATGKYVYATWLNDEIGSVVQVNISSDNGSSWADPSSTPGGTPSLSLPGFPAFKTRITTNATGDYVYAIWRRLNGANYVIQVARSVNQGVDWVDPAGTVPGSPNLSQPLQNADSPQIATDSTGQYVYAIWQRSNGSNFIIQVARSIDHGDNWSNPSATPTGATPNLSQPLGNAGSPQIATDSTGQYVYATWQRSDGPNTIIQAAVSSDFGDTWSDPTATPTGATPNPNLSQPLQNADVPQIATDSTGQYVYAIWQRSDGTYTIIQAARSGEMGVLFQLFGSQAQIRFPFQIDLANKLSWNNLSEAVAYRIYTDPGLSNRIGEIFSPGLEFLDHQIKYGTTRTYYVTWVNSADVESDAIQITIP